MKLEDDSGRWREAQPFWIHYQWKEPKHNSARGQYQFFRSWNYKYAYDRWRTVVAKYWKQGNSITFTLSTGYYPSRKLLLSSHTINDPGTQTLVGWLMRQNFLVANQVKDEKKAFILVS